MKKLNLKKCVKKKVNEKMSKKTISIMSNDNQGVLYIPQSSRIYTFVREFISLLKCSRHIYNQSRLGFCLFVPSINRPFI